MIFYRSVERLRLSATENPSNATSSGWENRQRIVHKRSLDRWRRLLLLSLYLEEGGVCWVTWACARSRQIAAMQRAAVRKVVVRTAEIPR
jgi:hypothetical protein